MFSVSDVFIARVSSLSAMAALLGADYALLTHPTTKPGVYPASPQDDPGSNVLGLKPFPMLLPWKQVGFEFDHLALAAGFPGDHLWLAGV